MYDLSYNSNLNDITSYLHPLLSVLFKDLILYLKSTYLFNNSINIKNFSLVNPTFTTKTIKAYI